MIPKLKLHDVHKMGLSNVVRLTPAKFGAPFSHAYEVGEPANGVVIAQPGMTLTLTTKTTAKPRQLLLACIPDPRLYEYGFVSCPAYIDKDTFSGVINLQFVCFKEFNLDDIDYLVTIYAHGTILEGAIKNGNAAPIPTAEDGCEENTASLPGQEQAGSTGTEASVDGEFSEDNSSDSGEPGGSYEGDTGDEELPVTDSAGFES